MATDEQWAWVLGESTHKDPYSTFGSDHHQCWQSFNAHLPMQGTQQILVELTRASRTPVGMRMPFAHIIHHASSTLVYYLQRFCLALLPSDEMARTGLAIWRCRQNVNNDNRLRFEIRDQPSQRQI